MYAKEPPKKRSIHFSKEELKLRIIICKNTQFFFPPLLSFSSPKNKNPNFSFYLLPIIFNYPKRIPQKSILALSLFLHSFLIFTTFHSESLSMLPIAFNPLGFFLEVFFSLTSYLSWHKSCNHVPGCTKRMVLCINLALFFGL